MGEVYRARETRLDRTVAIKVLPEHRLFDSGMRQRFVREARAIGNLSHPNICHLNDLGTHEGIDFLVMEYLDGETLADRVKRARGPLPLEEVFRIAIEMGDALSEAHRQGIVHRDLKPGNVMLTATGVKLLDFGLAKISPPSGVAAASTIVLDEAPLTSDGVVMGTWQYMAPEQLEGKDADARSDVFAFGAVIHEMATGKRAFDGESQASVIAAVLERDPPSVSSLQPGVPAALDRLVRKCLAKNPEQRWQTTRDLVDELRWIAGESRIASQRVEPAAPARARRFPWAWLAAVATAAAVAAAIGWNFARPATETSSAPVRRFSLQAPAPAQLLSGFAISPDGRQVVFRARTDQGIRLYVRSLDQVDARQLPGTDNGNSHAFSPDGQSVAFFAGGRELKTVSLNAASAPMTLATITDCCAGSTITWFPGDAIHMPLIAKGIVRIPARGGAAVSVSVPDTTNREIDHHSPFPLPDGKGMLIGVHRGAEAFDVAVQRLDGTDRRVLVKDAFEPQYSPTGHLLYVQGETLLAASFDLERLVVTGAPVSLIENLSTFPSSGVAYYRFSADGTLGYTMAPSRAGRRLVWVDRQGRVEPVAVGPHGYAAPSLSPDSRRLAVQIHEGSRRDIWTHEFATGSLTRITFDGASAAPIWTPDGRRVVFTSTRNGRRQIFSQPADGSGQPELLVDDEHSVWAGSWSADLQTLAFTRQPPTDLTDIELLRVGQEPSTSKLLASAARESLPRISPNGRWLAYTSDETGRDEVYVMPLSGTGTKRQISVNGGGNAVWSRDGQELVYRSGSRFLVAQVASLPNIVGRPVEFLIPVRLAAERSDADFYGHPGYDVAADGRLLVVEQAPEEAAPGAIHLVLNWFEELRRRVPVATSR
jgi:Tol biopolymer transport system component